MSENNREPAARISSVRLLTPRNLSFALIVLQILLAIGTYPFMPERVASHWGISGQVNGYMPKLWNAVFFPALSIVLYVFVRGLVALGPNPGSTETRHVSQKLVDQFLVVLLLFILIIQAAIAAFALGYPIDMLAVVNIAVALMFIVIGNYLGKVPRNFWAGIRTPWTLASDAVWERTHRLGGWLFVLAGLLTFLLNFISPLRAIAVVVPVVVITMILVVYSYVCFRQLAKNGQDPLSPPFS